METGYLNLLRLFHAHSVEYVVVGGYAVILHGHQRATGDIDLFVNPTLTNASRTVAALEAYGFEPGEFEETDFTTIPNFLSFSREEGWVDLLTDVRGVTFAECAVGALVADWDGVPVRFINLAALRKAKLATGRPQDLLDLENLPPA